ncbi:MAG: low-complexity tail membrane protein [Oscillatoriophycideae cyanobacterium NC_groundwater_1537_Pr4_S-0.65um_50_18]|nr:low-complexity tail membrane protein [Oscillatoriophycideae cyanobacterium NC_groundwater_1537_Pr4_S-0.65um_50_18]
MRSFWSDPYLWVHLAGAAAVPIFLEICLLGLGVGNPLRPMALEFVLVGAVGIAPVLWMQWQKPFSIFSLVILALKPEQLTIDQRRILKLFKAPLERVIAVITSVVLLALLWQLYQIAPIASEVTPFGRFGRLGGVLVAAIAFLGCNLFLQIPISVLQVLFTSEKQFAATEPYPTERIAQDFTLLGLPVRQILPTIQAEPQVKAKVPSSEGATAPEVALAAIDEFPEDPVADEQVIEALVVNDLVADERITEDPVADEQVIEVLIVDEPEFTEDPVADERVTDSPVADEQVIEALVVDEPVADNPVAEALVIEQLVVDDPVIDELIEKAPPVEESSANESIVEALTGDESATDESIVHELAEKQQELPLAPATASQVSEIHNDSETIHIIELELIEESDPEVIVTVEETSEIEIESIPEEP